MSNDTGGSATHTRLAATNLGGTKPDRDFSNEDNYTQQQQVVLKVVAVQRSHLKSIEEVH